MTTATTTETRETTDRVGTATVPTVRNAEFSDLMEMLRTQQAHKVDMVIPAGSLKFDDGTLVVDGQEMILDEDGFTDPNGSYHPTQIFDDQVADRLGITGSYLRRLRHGKQDNRGRETRPPRLDLWDANVNGLLHGRNPKYRANVSTTVGTVTEGTAQLVREGIPADERSFFVRLLKADHGPGIARALLSNRFARLDNIDGLLAMLEGLKDAGVDPDTLEIYGDLSETRMYVHVRAPQILTAAPDLLDGYRSPFDSGSEHSKRQTRSHNLERRAELGRIWREQGARGLRDSGGGAGMYRSGTEPLIHAGFLLTNSEVGNGRWQIVPEITVLACSNGMTITRDAFARTHVGSKMDDGHIAWSEDTQSKELSLVKAQTRDIVAKVLSADYLDEKAEQLARRAGAEIEEPEKTIEVVAKKLAFTKAEQEGILRHFLMSGQSTAGGVLNAVTSYSQVIEDADAAHEINVRAIPAMEAAYALA